MRLLIGIKSCQKDRLNGYHQTIRETWGKNLPGDVDLLFFVGGLKPPVKLEKDERHVPVDDGYWELLAKTKAIMRYALQHDYDFSYMADTDSYLNVSGMMTCGFEAYDYCGGFINPVNETFGKTIRPWRTFPHDCLIEPAYAAFSGGHGSFLSKYAMKIASVFPWPCGEGEDFMIGTALGPFIISGEIKAAILPVLRRYTFHLGCGYYGGGHIERKDVNVALREKHEEIISGKIVFEPESAGPVIKPVIESIIESAVPYVAKPAPIRIPDYVTRASIEYQRKKREEEKNKATFRSRRGDGRFYQG
jgi:hypothetical protein